MHFAIDAEHRAVCVDDGGRIAIHACRLPLEQRDHQHDAQFLRQPLHGVGRVARDRFRQIEPLALLRFAEVRRLKELLQAHDLRAFTSRLANEPVRPLEVRGDIGCRMVLNDADGEWIHVPFSLRHLHPVACKL